MPDASPWHRRLVSHRRLALLLCVATLLLKLLVPTGYMISDRGGHLAITPCPGVTSRMVGSATSDPPHAMAGMTMHHAGAAHDRSADHDRPHHGQVEMPCAFAGLSATLLGTVDPVLLVTAMAFAMAAGFGPVRRLASFAAPYLRPPPRAPPAVS